MNHSTKNPKIWLLFPDPASELPCRAVVESGSFRCCSTVAGKRLTRERRLASGCQMAAGRWMPRNLRHCRWRCSIETRPSHSQVAIVHPSSNKKHELDSPRVVVCIAHKHEMDTYSYRLIGRS